MTPIWIGPRPSTAAERICNSHSDRHTQHDLNGAMPREPDGDANGDQRRDRCKDWLNMPQQLVRDKPGKRRGDGCLQQRPRCTTQTSLSIAHERAIALTRRRLAGEVFHRLSGTRTRERG